MISIVRLIIFTDWSNLLISFKLGKLLLYNITLLHFLSNLSLKNSDFFDKIIKLSL